MFLSIRIRSKGSARDESAGAAARAAGYHARPVGVRPARRTTWPCSLTPLGWLPTLTLPARSLPLTRRLLALLRLPRAGFDELVLSHPQILEVVADLSEERSESLDAILSGHAQWTEEGLVLI